MADSFEHDLRQEPERLEDEHFPAAGGGTYWPHLVYAMPEGVRPLMLDLRVPQAEVPVPLLVYIHGGAWRLGTSKYDNPTLRALALPERLHRAGYAVARISYRLSGEATWPAPLVDCVEAIRWLRGRAAAFGIDPGRIAVMGESAGGHLACMVGLTASAGKTDAAGGIAAVVNWYGVTDLWAMHEAPGAARPGNGDLPEEALIGAPRGRSREALIAASPISHVHPGAPPFLHQHGDRDRLVPLSQAEALHAALREADVPSELDVVAGADHCFWGANTSDIVDRTIAFLDARLRPHVA